LLEERNGNQADSIGEQLCANGGVPAAGDTVIGTDPPGGTLARRDEPLQLRYQCASKATAPPR